jgi:hypothetical protein
MVYANDLAPQCNRQQQQQLTWSPSPVTTICGPITVGAATVAIAFDDTAFDIVGVAGTAASDVGSAIAVTNSSVDTDAII